MIMRRGQIETSTIIYWMIAILVLVLVLGGYMILSGRAEGAIEMLKNIFRFGR